ncbi:hypothetical protein PGT21_004134 [Puccinia graminis f. sp. tritici]|uniref:Carboxypeptidase n=1 Tax=Puccinia graminis f. sp. tritici TaxID=56615 RepID=A0A5B0M8W6_PUCGR|nr:hypothetical protein PGT21_004134 [Puccinia graminis f. sp. tritici]
MKCLKQYRRTKSKTALRLLNLTALSFELILIILLSTRRAAGGKIILPESKLLQKRDVDRRRSLGQVPVINGVIGGSPAGEDNFLDDGTDTADRPRVYKNLLSHNSTAPGANNSSVQVNAAPSICSGQPGSVTGYISPDPSRSIFFWFLEARRNPDQSPLILWLNGGPGSSSMIGLFQENGPCKIKLDSSGFDANGESWNENANMIYIDQPVGTGYSYGTRTAKTTLEAMIDLYEALQLFLAHPLFAKFVGRQFGVWTESYGGHYAPVLVDHILEMNFQLESSKQPGRVPIPIKSLGIGNGLTNPLVQYLSYITYAQSNPYNQSMVPKDFIQTASTDFSTPATGCHDLIKTCQSSLKAASCRQAQSFCNRKILSRLAGDRDVYDVRQPSTNPYPPDLAPILNDVKFKSMIGVSPTLNWTESNEDVYTDFFSTGDWMLDSSKQLERIIDSGVRTLLYAGDADYIVNYQGVEALVTSLNTSASKGFANDNFTDWVVDGEVAGACKSAGVLSYLRVFEAGHEVPAYGKGKLGVGRAAKVFFDLTNDGQSVCPPLVARDLNPRQNNSNVPRDASSTTSALDKSSFYLIFPLFACLLLAL